MEEDRIKWDERYRSGAYGSRTYPNQFLESQLLLLEGGFHSALDVACGAGRNSLFLAERGMEVLGLDISPEAIKLAKLATSYISDSVIFEVVDLDEGLHYDPDFDLIVMIRYVNDGLLYDLQELLNPNGVLIVEQHMVWPDDKIELAGPKNPQYRVEPGEIEETLSELTREYKNEGLIRERDGQVSAVSQYVGRKPYPNY